MVLANFSNKKFGISLLAKDAQLLMFNKLAAIMYSLRIAFIVMSQVLYTDHGNQMAIFYNSIIRVSFAHIIPNNVKYLFWRILHSFAVLSGIFANNFGQWVGFCN